MSQSTKNFYEQAYGAEQLKAQRRWPNEEFCRFMGRNFFSESDEERKSTRILEAGCGTGANLRVLAAEGFDAYGIELSKEAVGLIPLLLGREAELCKVFCGNMMELLWEDGYFHGIVDVLSSYCLDETDFAVFVDEVYRTLIRGADIFLTRRQKDPRRF